jgi:hypothetical protein
MWAATACDRGLLLLLLVVKWGSLVKSIRPRFSCIRKATREPRLRRRSRIRSWAILPKLTSLLLLLLLLLGGVRVDGEWGGGVRGDKVRSICVRGVRGVLGEDGVVGLILEEKVVGDRRVGGGGDRGDRCCRNNNEVVAKLLLG